MQVIMKRPGQAAEVGDLADYKAMHEYCGGCMETVPLVVPTGEMFLIVCNEDFSSHRTEPNIFLSGVLFFGNIFICGVGEVNGERDFVGLSSDDMLEVMRCIGWKEADIINVVSAALS